MHVLCQTLFQRSLPFFLLLQDGGSLLCAIDEGNDHNISVWDWQKTDKGHKITETKVCSVFFFLLSRGRWWKIFINIGFTLIFAGCRSFRLRWTRSLPQNSIPWNAIRSSLAAKVISVSGPWTPVIPCTNVTVYLKRPVTVRSTWRAWRSLRTETSCPEILTGPSLYGDAVSKRYRTVVQVHKIDVVNPLPPL